MKASFGWLALANIVVYLGMLWGNGATQVRTLHAAASVVDRSASALLGVFLCVMLYDKFSDRVAVYEAMEEGPNNLPEATPGQRPPASPSPSSGAPHL